MEYRPNKKVLVKRYLEMANERLESAEALLKIDNFPDSISRSYYASLDAATAALVSINVAPRSHAGAINLFGKHFVEKGLIPEKFGRWFNQIEKARLQADYKHLKDFTREEAEDALKTARDFVRVVNELLSGTKK